MRYIALDTETTGLDPAKHQLLEVAMAFCDTGSMFPERIISVRFFYPTESVIWDSVAQKMHQGRICRDYQEHTGLDPVIDAISFAEANGIRVDHYCVPPDSRVGLSNERMVLTPWEKWMVAGKNPAFDLGFLGQNKWWGDLNLPVDYRLLDVGSMFIGLCGAESRNGTMLRQYSLESMMDYVRARARGLGDLKLHDALSDALRVSALVYFGWPHAVAMANGFLQNMRKGATIETDE